MTNFVMLKRFEIIASRALLFMDTLMFNSIGASPSEHKVIAGAVLFLRLAKHKALVKQDQDRSSTLTSPFVVMRQT